MYLRFIQTVYSEAVLCNMKIAREKKIGSSTTFSHYKWGNLHCAPICSFEQFCSVTVART